jgi:hypothetical protein
MDMVGGGIETKAVFHIIRGPMSLPSFGIPATYMNDGTGSLHSYEFGFRGKYQIADELSAEYGAVSSELGAEYLQALKRIGLVG